MSSLTAWRPNYLSTTKTSRFDLLHHRWRWRWDVFYLFLVGCRWGRGGAARLKVGPRQLHSRQRVARHGASWHVMRLADGRVSKFSRDGLRPSCDEHERCNHHKSWGWGWCNWCMGCRQNAEAQRANLKRQLKECSKTVKLWILLSCWFYLVYTCVFVVCASARQSVSGTRSIIWMVLGDKIDAELPAVRIICSQGRIRQGGKVTSATVSCLHASLQGLHTQL